MRIKLVTLTSLMTVLLVGFLTVNVSADSKEISEKRIVGAQRVLDEMMIAPDVSIPEELLAKCKAIVIYPRMIKGGFIFGGRYGKGVALRHNVETGEWSAPAFSTLGGVSWGFQIGGQAVDLILVVLNEDGLNGLLSGKFTLGADASIAVGPVGRASEAAVGYNAAVLSYARTQGLFAGVAFDGTYIGQDNNSNADYYGQSVTSTDILLNNAVEISPSGAKLVASLEEYSGRWAKRKAKKSA